MGAVLASGFMAILHVVETGVDLLTEKVFLTVSGLSSGLLSMQIRKRELYQNQRGLTIPVYVRSMGIDRDTAVLKGGGILFTYKKTGINQLN